MPKILGYGSIGRYNEMTRTWIFMVLYPLPDFPKKDVVQAIILNGTVSFGGEDLGPGTIGPVAIDDPDIEWLE